MSWTYSIPILLPCSREEGRGFLVTLAPPEAELIIQGTDLVVRIRFVTVSPPPPQLRALTESQTLGLGFWVSASVPHLQNGESSPSFGENNKQTKNGGAGEIPNRKLQ